MSSVLAGRAETIHVLHVDDEPDFADLAAIYLEREDDRFAVETATSATEGLDYLAANEVDCIISDYDMPAQNGIQFLETVREDYPELPFILYTGKGSEEVASDAISAGVTDYLQKESGTDQYTVLANRVRNAVEGFRAEQARQRQQEAIETAREGISILNSDGEFIYVNQTYADLYGYEPEELLGNHWEVIYPDDEVAFTREEILPTVAEEGYWHGETTGLRADGTTFPEDHVVSQTSQDALVCTVRDLSDRRERETELRMKTRAMDEAPLGITITDPAQDDNPLIYVNEWFEEMTGYDREEVIGQNCRFLQGQDTAEEPVAEMRAAIDADEPVTVELRNYRKDGTEFWNRVSIAPVYDETGSVSHYVGFQQDVTEEHRRRARRQRHRETLLDLTTDNAVVAGGFETATQRITETAAEVLDVPRVNVWLVDDDGDDAVFRCVDHYDRDADEHVRGMELDPDEYPAYFEALATHRTIDAVDARQDPRTAELTDDYLNENDIGALLDGTLRSEGDVVGVICHEQTGGPREWTDDEIEFVGNISDILHRALRNQERKAREQELEQTNALLSTLIETLPMGILVEDESRNVQTVNDQLFELFELPGTPDDVVGADCERLAKEVSDAFADPDRFVNQINTLIANREPVRNEELSLRDGRTFARSYEPVELPGGDGHLWVYRDITEQKEHQQAIESLHSTARALMQADTADEIADIVVSAADDILGMPANGVHLYDEEQGGLVPAAWTERTEELVGEPPTFAPGEGIGGMAFETGEEQIYDDISTISARYNPDTAVRSQIALPLADYGVLLIGSEEVGAFDDTDVDLARTLATHATTALMRLNQDIELRTKTARLEALYEHSPDMIDILDPDGRIRDVNQRFCTELGYSEREVLGRPIWDIDRLVDVEDVRALLSDFSAGERRKFEGEYERADGSTFPVEVHLLRLDLAGEDRFLAISRDITERKERERELERQNERLNQFASVVSHDLRNPLNVAEGRIALAREDHESEQLSAAAEAIDRSLTLLDDLLLLAREGEEVSEIEVVDLADVIANCWQNVETDEATLLIETEQTIQADSSRLKQLLENLFRNAVDHGGEDVTITVGELTDRDGFYVADDGPGIPENDREQVFEAGYSTADDGTGFGLNIVREIAKAHNWRIVVTESEQGGARFEITGVEVAAE